MGNWQRIRPVAPGVASIAYTGIWLKENRRKYATPRGRWPEELLPGIGLPAMAGLHQIRMKSASPGNAADLVLSMGHGMPCPYGQ